uniref:Uncharacterized protein n=1 Tax=Musa acuminata subsp. malaccensis TaxID=214687 RepID=A0A804K814_MUSAM
MCLEPKIYLIRVSKINQKKRVKLHKMK